MAQDIQSVMTAEPVCMDAGTTLTEAAKEMERRDIGDVLVVQDGKLCGIVTDRDIAIRAVAHEKDPAACKLGDVCSRELIMLRPEDGIDDAIAQMREHAVRRLPVVSNGEPIGIVSLGDLAKARDRQSVLGEISAAPANH